MRSRASLVYRCSKAATVVETKDNSLRAPNGRSLVCIAGARDSIADQGLESASGLT